MVPRTGVPPPSCCLFDKADATVAAVHGFDQAGLDEGLDVFVEGAAGGQAEGLAEFVVGWGVVIIICCVINEIIDRFLVGGGSGFSWWFGSIC